MEEQVLENSTVYNSDQSQQSPSKKVVQLSGGPHWGFRTCGGRDTNIPIRIARVNPGSKAARSGIREGDLVTVINGLPIDHMTNGEVQRILKKSGTNMTLELKSAKRMTTFEGSASAGGELDSTGASSSVVTKKSSEKAQSSSSVTTATSSPNLALETNGSVLGAEGEDQQQQINGGSGTLLGKKSKKSPSHSSLKVGKSSKSKKTVEFQERCVDEDETNRRPGAAAASVEVVADDEQRGKAEAEESQQQLVESVWAPGSTSKNNSSSASPSSKGRREEEGGSGVGGGSDQVDSRAVPLPALEEQSPAVWTPSNAPSPSTQRKFRPVNFNVPSSPTSSTPHTISLERSFSAGHVGDRKLTPADQHNLQQQQQQHHHHHHQGSNKQVEGGTSEYSKTLSDHSLHQSHSSSSVNLPRYQSPTVTLLQKAREGHLPKGALYLDHKNSSSGGGGVQRSSSASGGFNSLLSQQHPAAGPSSSSQHQPSSTPSLNPNDTLYELKKEDIRTTSTGATRRAEFTPKKYDGVGPTTPEGVPIALKSGISSNGHEWYRRMYESLHVDNKPQRKGVPQRYPYIGPSGSLSDGYESDTYAYKYATLDRRKVVRDRYLADSEYLSPGASTPTSVPGSIRFTPGRIEDYTPGNSSVVAKEIRKHKPTLQWALGSKDFGYESDSNIVIKRRQEAQDIPPPPPLSPAEQHQLYVEVQKGGEVPFHGLRKLAPEKHKASPVKYSESEVNIHYKAPIRLVEKDYIGEEELRKRQEQSMKRFYEEQRQRKFLQEIQDMENRRHTDNFTPSQKSPIPLNRYEDMIDEPQRPKWRERTPERVVARACYNFVPQNSRELSFRKGDILYIRRKLDSNWYEGEHNAAVGIFPASYVEIIPSYEVDRATPRAPSEGQARVRFNFTAASPIEMSIVKGETVILTRRVDINWYEGRIGSRRGIFPVSYVQVLREPGSDLTATSPKPIGSPAAHSLAAHQNFRHNYKPNDYVISSDYSSLNYDSRNSPAPHIPTYGSRADTYGAERVTSTKTSTTSTTTPQQVQGRSSYSHNLTIDTRIEPLPYKAIYNYRPAHEDELELKENDVVHVLEKCDDGWYVGTSTRTGLFGTFPGNYVERVF